jgi:hypothetical protein
MTANDVMKDKANKFVNPDLYPGGQDAGWNVPQANGGNMASGAGGDGGGSTIPGCPAQNTPAVNRPNPYRFTRPNAPTGNPEVFHSSGYNTLDYNAESVCSNYNGAKQATKAQLAAAQAAGADWCSTGWVSDNFDAQYPINVSLVQGCGSSPGIQSWTPPSKKAGVNCYGIKPKEGEFPEIKPWTPGVYYQKDYVKPAPPPPPPIPPPEWDVSTSRIAGYVDIPVGDYTLSFDITANSKSMGRWGNIIHVTNGQGDCCGLGMRAPAIWFFPDDTRLHVRIGSTADGNWGIDTDPLPLGQKVNFNLTTSGSQVNLSVNGKSYNQTQPGKRPTGTGFKIYMNDLKLNPGYQAAPAKIQNFKYIVDGKTVNVLQKGEAPAPPAPAKKCNPPLANPPAEVSGWKYKGCFRDCSQGRGLPHRLPNVGSIEACIAQAKARGFNTSGNQYFGECWAGNNSDWNKMGDAGCCEPLGGGCTQQIYSAT